MEGRFAGAIEIAGGLGSGKTTALRRLAAKAPADRNIEWVDDANLLDVVGAMKDGWVIYTLGHTGRAPALASFSLAGWGDDERIEYLLAIHPRGASVDATDFTSANLAQADLRGFDLRTTRLDGVSLASVNLEKKATSKGCR